MTFFLVSVTGLATGLFTPIGIIEADDYPHAFKKLGFHKPVVYEGRFWLPPETEVQLVKDNRGEKPKFEIRHFPNIESMADLLIELNRFGYLHGGRK